MNTTNFILTSAHVGMWWLEIIVLGRYDDTSWQNAVIEKIALIYSDILRMKNPKLHIYASFVRAVLIIVIWVLEVDLHKVFF